MAQLEQVDGRELARPILHNPVRTAVRFPMRLALTIQTEFGELKAVTENVSANGILFVCDYLPAIDSRIEFSMAMPSAIMASDRDVIVHCIGRIVRHVHEGREKKAAAVIDEYFLKV